MNPTVSKPLVTRFRKLYEQATIPLGQLCLRQARGQSVLLQQRAELLGNASVHVHLWPAQRTHSAAHPHAPSHA